MVTLPSRIVPPVMRALRFNRHYLTRESSERHLAELAAITRVTTLPRRFGRDLVVRTGDWYGRPLFRVSPPGPDSAVGTVVYLHGGAFIHGIHPLHWRLIEYVVRRARVEVVVPIYPLIHEGGTAELVVGRVAELVRELGPRTALAGDSAGGAIAISTALLLRDQGWVVPQTLLIAPPLDLELVHEGLADLAPLDPWLHREGILPLSERWLADRGFGDPVLNPINADPTGLGPVTLFVGTRDILWLNARDYVERLRAAGVDVEYHEGLGEVHVYPILPTPAGRRARTRIAAKLAETFAHRPAAPRS